MNLVLRRRPSFGGATIGELFLGDERVCFTLEDQVREVAGAPVSKWKISRETAIPAGRYRIVIDFSNRFQRMTPRLLNVPGFEGIRIHPGNCPADTEGCLLPGTSTVNDRWVSQSGLACAKLTGLIKLAIDRGEEVWIDVCSADA